MTSVLPALYSLAQYKGQVDGALISPHHKARDQGATTAGAFSSTSKNVNEEEKKKTKKRTSDKASSDSNAPVKKKKSSKKSSKNTPPATTVTGTVESCDQIAETLEDISIVAINERSTQRAGCELNQSEQIVQKSASRDLSTSSLKGVTRDKPAHTQHAQKEPKKRPLCPNPMCVSTRDELSELKEKYGALEARFRRLSRSDGIQGNELRVPNVQVNDGRVGVMSEAEAAMRKLVELVAGSGVFLSRTALALCKTAHTKSSLATRLLKAFFSEEERREGKISEQGEVGNLLNQQIITTIKAYASRQNLPDGCKKGITSAMNLSIKNLRRAARKSACEDDLPSLPSLPDDDDDDYDADESLLD
ncbi:uncharacterized protein LOC125567851 isoform X3 [Nematostella vectensis]|uniref:uncharacterized protein LOC125567851 isoform X3 n=1 Tax=Nematostella vectensis TaxID=45351 RepID=UPI0020772F33|nr:uncharacterized protein LOC125567851 isoform X3 [Nematostella vectensis]